DRIQAKGRTHRRGRRENLFCNSKNSAQQGSATLQAAHRSRRGCAIRCNGRERNTASSETVGVWKMGGTNMRATCWKAPRHMAVENVPEPQIQIGRASCRERV